MPGWRMGVIEEVVRLGDLADRVPEKVGRHFRVWVDEAGSHSLGTCPTGMGTTRREEAMGR